MTRHPSRWIRSACAAVFALVPACTEAHTVLDDGGGVLPLDTTAPNVDANLPPAPVDLLLMIDDSNSMAEEQAILATDLPRMIAMLASGDRNGDGVRDVAPPSSIHVGIVDSDMGLGDVTGIATCGPGFGDDGLMQIRPRERVGTCMADYSGIYPTGVFDFAAPSSAAAFAADVACVAALGTQGCGFEFQLEAPLKAISLTPTGDGTSPVSWTHAGYRPPSFFAHTFGHGDDPATNGAFLRPDSVLAIVTITDEDDCSTGNPHIFSPDDPRYFGVDLNLRCHMFADELHPISRYADGFLGLRTDPRRLVYGTISGVPTFLAGMDPATILADPLMVEQIDPESGNHLLASCVASGGRGHAMPAVRMTQLAQQLQLNGARTSVQSICADDFGPALDAILAEIFDAL